ncbi:MAG: hypothetical protein WC595_00690 [Candidatus Nanoarchaeia archaeon]
MALEKLLAPFKWLDTEVQRKYTHWRKDREGPLFYSFTSALAWMGTLFAPLTNPVYPEVFISYALAVFPDHMLNVERGRNPTPPPGTKYLLEETLNGWNQKIRLPLFLAGVGHLGVVGYDLLNYRTNLNVDTSHRFAQGIGLLSSASSMYLKDQDKGLLDKKSIPDRIADYLKGQVRIPQPAEDSR